MTDKGKKVAKVLFRAYYFDYFVKSLGLKRGDVLDQMGIGRLSNFYTNGVSPDFCGKLLSYLNGSFVLSTDNTRIDKEVYENYVKNVSQGQSLFYVELDPKVTGLQVDIIKRAVLIRHLMGMSQEDMGKYLGVSRVTVSNLETGNFKKVDIATMDKIEKLVKENDLDAWL